MSIAWRLPCRRHGSRATVLSRLSLANRPLLYGGLGVDLYPASLFIGPRFLSPAQAKFENSTHRQKTPFSCSSFFCSCFLSSVPSPFFCLFPSASLTLDRTQSLFGEFFDGHFQGAALEQVVRLWTSHLEMFLFAMKHEGPPVKAMIVFAAHGGPLMSRTKEVWPPRSRVRRQFWARRSTPPGLITWFGKIFIRPF